MSRGAAPGKVNLALVVGPIRDDGKHELITLYQRVALSDRLVVERASSLSVSGFADDTLVTRALAVLSAAAGETVTFSARIWKQVPVAAGLGGGSSDAATALRLANDLLDQPLGSERLVRLGAALGADVPFFLTDGPQLGSGDGTELSPVQLPQDYWILLLLPHGADKSSTAAVYADFDRRGGGDGFDRRRDELLEALAAVQRSRDLEHLPANDLVSSPLAGRLRELGAFRADVTGAGPTVYGLFLHEELARSAQHGLEGLGSTWITAPAWYR